MLARELLRERDELRSPFVAILADGKSGNDVDVDIVGGSFIFFDKWCQRNRIGAQIIARESSAYG